MGKRHRSASTDPCGQLDARADCEQRQAPSDEAFASTKSLNGQALPASDALPLPGPVTALWPAESRGKRRWWSKTCKLESMRLPGWLWLALSSLAISASLAGAVRPHYGGTLTVELSSAWMSLEPGTLVSIPIAETLVRVEFARRDRAGAGSGLATRSGL